MPTLRALIIDDSADDADLLCRELTRNGYDVESTRVDTSDDLDLALRARSWDIIFSDWHMPRFSGPEALEVVKAHGLDLPFIIVSGAVEEEVVVKAMKSGAHDFFRKERLTLLVPAVDRELREATVRRDSVQMEEQLIISDRMASVGILAAGVVHEINNPLSAVVGNLDLALEGLVELERAQGKSDWLGEVVSDLHEAIEAAQRIRNVANDLKTFARSDSSEAREAVDVQRVIESSLRMARNEIRHRAQIRTEFSPVPPVTGKESRLGQVFLNLIVNAAQAITEGHAEENVITVATTIASDGSVLVTVSDTGSGMTEETRRRLFTPFFTTKPIGVGTGLGLSICHRIISEMGGTITVESEIGRGSQFTVHLEPGGDLKADELAVNSAAASPTPRRRGIILAIDDEPSIGALIKKVLKEHDVTSTTNAEEALKWISRGSRYDVILCDLMMPHVTGMDFYAQLEQLDRTQASAVIFLTGGAFTAQARQFLEEVENDRLDKPFDIHLLRQVIDGRL
jgi:signal transduction histidine kinase